MSKPRPEQITEWFEGETTEYFFGLVEAKANVVRRALFDQGFDTTAELLQSRRANLWGLNTAYEEMFESFQDQSFISLEIEDDESESVSSEHDSKPIWDLSRWRSYFGSP